MSSRADRVFGKIGIDKFCRLRKAMLHRPTESLPLINSCNYHYFLFDAVPDVDGYLEEHDRYRRLLESQGVEVYELADYVVENRELMHRLPNLAYLHDTAVVTRNGAILSKMGNTGRKGEEIVVREALAHLGVNCWFEFGNNDLFEGCLVLSPQSLFIADTERHNISSIRKFVSVALDRYEEIFVVQVPKERRFMHPDMLFNRVSHHVALAYPAAFLRATRITAESVEEVDFLKLWRSRSVEIVEIDSEEQQRWATSFVPIEPAVIMNYEISLKDPSLKRLEELGVKVISFRPDKLLAGGGSLRCLTMRLLRAD